MRKKNMVGGSIVGLISSALAFFGMISACGFPIIAAFLAWFGIGASQLSFLSEYQSLFIVIAILALLYGFFTIYFKKAKVDDSSMCCSTENQCVDSSSGSIFQSKWLSKTMLWIATFAIMGTYFVDNKASNSNEANQSCNPTSSTDSANESCIQNFPCLNDTLISERKQHTLCSPKK
jgi:hypothetical protein